MFKYKPILGILAILFIQVFLANKIFCQTAIIKGRVEAKVDKHYSCNCYIDLVRIYLNSSNTSELFFNIDGFADLSRSPNTTITRFDGEFSMEISEEFNTDSLVFEHWAYKIKKIPVKELIRKKYSVIHLEPEIILLPSLKIKSLRKDSLPIELINQYTMLESIKRKTYSRYMPEFPGNIRCFYSYILKEIKTEKIKSKKPLIVEFTVSYQGKIEDIKILSDNNGKTNNAIIRVFKESPEWMPPRCRGPEMNYRFALPIILNGY